jgi:hypothetical protein
MISETSGTVSPFASFGSIASSSSVSLKSIGIPVVRDVHRDRGAYVVDALDVVLRVGGEESQTRSCDLDVAVGGRLEARPVEGEVEVHLRDQRGDLAEGETDDPDPRAAVHVLLGASAGRVRHAEAGTGAKRHQPAGGADQVGFAVEGSAIVGRIERGGGVAAGHDGGWLVLLRQHTAAVGAAHGLPLHERMRGGDCGEQQEHQDREVAHGSSYHARRSP